MSDHPWLQPGDELLLDGVDYRVVERFMGRADRLTFQRLLLRPQLGGEMRALLQLEEAMMEAQELVPDLLEGDKVQIDDRVLHLRWEGPVRTERSTLGVQAKFGSGRCAWYTADDSAVAVLVVERYERSAILGVPLAPARIDTRFTEGLRNRRS